MINYSISPLNINSHLFSVSLTFNAIADKPYTLSLPSWLPGSYMIRDFAKNIIEINATAENNNSPILIKNDKQTWTLTSNADTSVSVNYSIFAFDLSVRTAYLDSQRAFFNGSSVFLQVEELADQACLLDIKPNDAIKDWKVATGLTRHNTEKYAFGQYSAENYQELIDGPVAMGNFSYQEFDVEGITHHVVFTSEHYGDLTRLTNDLTKLCQHHISMFGEAPFKEYWFITHLLANGFGGLEHKNSTILQASRFDLPNPNKPDELTDDYRTFLSLCSHEYFHAWNVCRIKPKEFIPYNLQEETHTTQLWAYEGITSYYDDFSLYRTGLISFEDYLKILSKTATRVYRGKGELKQSVADSSFDTWTKFYKQGPDAVNNIVSYYTKGSLIALWLDLTIRDKSNGQYSLDNLMKELWIHFGRTNIGTSEDDFINIANILCNTDIRDEFTAMLHNAERVELSPLLKKVGIDFAASKFSKLNSVETRTTDEYIPYVGALYSATPSGLKVTQVIEDSPAAEAGLAVNDIIVAVDNMQATEKSLQNIAEHLDQNASVNCHYFRDDQLIEQPLSFIDSPASAIEITESDAELSSQWRNIIGL
ncbi:M61 family metallopeptidase [Pseudocolwellia sp. HL-MZ19]|uniref:M61 family metallopeptidase n=1 Tax=Pseudocolwellia sp. HL-MZ19 TaxID=3400846 RepID=UPI003CE6EA41